MLKQIAKILRKKYYTLNIEYYDAILDLPERIHISAENHINTHAWVVSIYNKQILLSRFNGGDSKYISIEDPEYLNEIDKLITNAQSTS